jgi:hypothetical protein
MARLVLSLAVSLFVFASCFAPSFAAVAVATRQSDVTVKGSIDVSCPECKLIVGVIFDIAGNKTSLNITEEIARSTCNSVFANDTTRRTTCLLIVDVIGAVLPLLSKGVNELAWNVPLTVCADLVKVCTEPCCVLATSPEQLRLSYAHSTDLSQMHVTWVTLNETPGAMVQYWGSPNAAPQVGKETTRTYTVGGWIGVIHMATMTGLHPGTNYTYRVGSSVHGWSKNVTFSTLPTIIGVPARPLRMVAIADMGYGPNSDENVAAMTALVDAGQVDLLSHYGDVSYADADEQHWDDFWRKVEPIASRVPYMTTPGNHELWWNFTAYQARCAMSMPSAGPNTLPGAMYYNLQIGTVHFVYLDSETWIDTPSIDAAQISWAKNRIASVNRTQVPWLVVMQHRGLYCTGDKFQCQDFGEVLRLQVEGLFNDLKVDVNIAGHIHNYLRMYPVYGGIVMGKSYTNPSTPVYFTNGAGGNREGQTGVKKDHEWVAAGCRSVGHQLLEFTADPVTGERIMVSKFIRAADGSVCDEVTVTKTA